MPDPARQKSDHIRQLERRLQAEPMSRLFLELARELHQAGFLDEAATVCSEGVKIHTTWRSARALLGRIYFDLDRLDEAREQLEEVIAHAPDNLVARRILADICVEEGDLDGAIERYQALMAFNPSDAEVAGKIGDLEEQRRGRASAPAQAPARSAEAPRETAPPPATAAPDPAAEAIATPTLAEIYAEQGHTDRAIEIYREVLRADPSHAEAIQRIWELSGSPAARAALPREEVVRRRKVRALRDWLANIQGGAGA